MVGTLRDPTGSSAQAWPALRVADWRETRETLHMWTQIVGKVRMANAPMLEHWWQVPFYVTPSGLTTSTIPYQDRVFDIEFDFLDQMLRIRSSDGQARTIALEAMTVATFYQRLMRALDDLELSTAISTRPNEIEVAIPFDRDRTHATYDPEAARRFWRQLTQAYRVISRFRASFTGKVSPVHVFWGALDLACTRFSGRAAPTHPGGAPNCGDWVMVEAYSQELASCGFWPGGGEEGAFYAYAYPEPAGYPDASVQPSEAFYSRDLGEFVLPYETVRLAPDPDELLTTFLQSTYAAAADLGQWDRASLECDPDRLAGLRFTAASARTS